MAPSGVPHRGRLYLTPPEAHPHAYHTRTGTKPNLVGGTRSQTPTHTCIKSMQSSRHPSGNTDGSGLPLYALTETLVRNARPMYVRPRVLGADVQTMRLRATRGGPIVAHVFYIREDSPMAWSLPCSLRDRAIDATCMRVGSRGSVSDGGGDADSPSGGVYVATGSSTRVPAVPTRSCPRGPMYLPHIERFVPFRHANATHPDVIRVVETCAPVMGAAAQVLEKYVPHVLAGMWDPVHANPALSDLFSLPPPWMQDGRAVTEDAPLNMCARVGPAIPTQHVASRVSGIPDLPSAARVQLACEGLSNHHIDRVDSVREHGVPIIYIPRFSPLGRSSLTRARLLHPLPSSDLILAENDCAGMGGRVWRIVTCVDGFVCIVCTNYAYLMHGNVYPDAAGDLYDDGSLLLARHLPRGVELLRLVVYSLRTLDSFIHRFQVAYDACTDQDQRMSLVRELHVRLEAPLRARLERMYPALASGQ